MRQELTVSVTEIEGYLRCRRLGTLASFNGASLSRLMSPSYFSVGSIWHSGHEEWITVPYKDFRQIMWEHASTEVDNIKARYKARLGFPPTDAELEPVLNAIFMLPFMAENYQKVWHTPLPENYVCIAPEQTIIVDMPNYQHLHLELTIDALIQNTTNGKLLLLERKTYRSRPRLETLQNNNQFLRYIWGCRRAGFDVVGTAYDGAWKRQGPTRKGMQLDEMFLRTTLLRSPHEVEAEGESIEYDILQMYNDPYFRNNHTTLFHPGYYVPWNGCFDCQFKKLCEAHRKNEDWPHILATEYGPRQRQGYALVDNDE